MTRRRSPFQTAAKLSCVLPLFAIAINWSIRWSGVRISRETAIIMLCFNIALIVAGFISAIIALFGIPKRGREGILTPALLGLVFNALFIGVIALGMNLTREAKQRAEKEIIDMEKMGEKSFLEYPGWFGAIEHEGVIIAVAEMDEASPLTREVLKEFDSRFLILLFSVDNSGGKQNIVLDPSSVRLHRTDGSVLSALPLDKVMATAKTDKEDWLRKFSGPIKAAPGQSVLDRFACLPSGTDMRNVDMLAINSNTGSLTANGTYLTAKERQEIVRRGREMEERAQ